VIWRGFRVAAVVLATGRVVRFDECTPPAPPAADVVVEDAA